MNKNKKVIVGRKKITYTINKFTTIKIFSRLTYKENYND